MLGTLHWGRKAGRNIAAFEVWTDEPVESSIPTVDTAAEVAAAISNADGSFIAGTYESTAMGRNGELPVTVELSDTAITSISFGENAESAGIGDVALDRMAAKILIAQSVDVDTVAGATITSMAIINGVDDCMTQGQK